ncbi:MAG: putative RAN, Ras superfamily GTPase, partial [Streblomastix strix]
MEIAKQNASFKLVLLGDSGVGKSTFVIKHQTHKLEDRYIATIGVDIRNLTLYTNRGPITFNMYDIAGQDSFQGQHDDYYANAKCAILMFDVMSQQSQDNVEK